MNWNRVKAIVLKSRYTFGRDMFRLFDIFWWPAFQLFIWGLFSTYLQKASGSHINFVSILLGGVILWTFFDRASRDISLNLIDELWNKNFVNLFSSPLSVSEYLTGTIIMAIGKLILSALFMLFLAGVFYSFNISSIGFYFIPAAVGLTIMGWTMSFIVQSCIMRWGHTVEIFIWAIATLVQPFSAVFYPLSALPGWGQKISYFLPTSYLFENMRSAMTTHTVHPNEIVLSFGLNILYLCLSVFFFYRSFDHAKKQGLLIKNY